MKALSNLAQSVRASTTLAIDTQFNKMRSEGIDVIGFSVGQPDFPTPEHIKQAGIRAIQENLTKYTPTPGTPAVRKAVADRLDADWGLDYTPEEIVVSGGGKPILYVALKTLIDPGDEVICIKKRILADTTPVIYSIDYLPRSLFGNRDYTRIDLTGDIFEILEQECHQQISSNVAHLKASCGDEAIRAAMRLAPGEAMLLLDEVCFNRLCRPVMRSLSYYTNFFDFSILRKLL